MTFKIFQAQASAHFPKGRIVRALSLVCVSALLASCASDPVKVKYVKKKQEPQAKEYFAEKDYGVKASPRVVVASSNVPGVKLRRMPRGGGRDQVGKPYKIRGKWYYPKEDLAYNRTGMASWYGDAFHGRKTANGEIYDMNQLSAAHPTMPLPSYAKVTNLKNGHSIIVRVNDRGPYAHGRIIDMSKRAAQMLDYTGSGVAQVRVQYVGRAQLDGQDDQYLLASFSPGTGTPVQDAVQPAVMVASTDPVVDAQGAGGAVAFEGNDVLPSAAASLADPFAALGGADIPAVGPVIPDKPIVGPTPVVMNISTKWTSAYANERINAAYGVSAPFKAMGLTESRLKQSWKRQPTTVAPNGEYVMVGTFADSEAKKLVRALSAYGAVTDETSDAGTTISLTADDRLTGDELLEACWNLGASEAFIVRN